MKNQRKKNSKFTISKKDYNSIIETIMDNEAMIKMIEDN